MEMGSWMDDPFKPNTTQCVSVALRNYNCIKFQAQYGITQRLKHFPSEIQVMTQWSVEHHHVIDFVALFSFKAFCSPTNSMTSSAKLFDAELRLHQLLPSRSTHLLQQTDWKRRNKAPLEGLLVCTKSSSTMAELNLPAACATAANDFWTKYLLFFDRNQL